MKLLGGSCSGKIKGSGIDSGYENDDYNLVFNFIISLLFSK